MLSEPEDFVICMLVWADILESADGFAEDFKKDES